MKSLWNTVKSLHQNNQGMLLAALVQLGVILFFVFWLCTPAQSHEVALQEFISEETAQSVTLRQDGALAIANTQTDAGKLVLHALPFSLAKGAYTVQIDTLFQQSEAGASASFEEEVARGTFFASERPLQLKTKSLRISEAAHQTSSRLWVNAATGLDLNFTLSCPVGASLVVQRITLRENVLWRWLLFVAALLLFALVDAGYLLLFARGNSALRRGVMGAKIPLALAGSVIVASLPSFADFAYGGHDMSFHCARIGAVAQGLAEGQFPVRMMGEMLNGYGYANSIFYCDIFLYCSAFLYNCMLPLSAAYQVYLILVNIATCLIAYFCLLKLCSNRSLAWLGASLYLMAAYRLLNVYTRAAAGEYTAMAFFPLLILGMYGIYANEKPKVKHWLPFALGMAGIVQCHMLSLAISVIFTALFCVLALRKTLTLPRIKAWCCAAGLSLGLSAWFLVPFADYMRKISINVNTTGDPIQDTGLYLGQLCALFGNASGFSGLGTQGEMPLSLGWSLLLGAAIAVYCLMKAAEWEMEDTPRLQLLRALVGMGLIAVLFSLQAFPWDMISSLVGSRLAPLVNVIQFSWRYLSVATLCLSFATVMALAILKDRGAKHWRSLAGGVLGLLLLTTSVYQSSYYQTAAAVEWETAEQTVGIIGLGEYLLGGVGLDDYLALDFGDNTAVEVQTYQTVAGHRELTCYNRTNEAQSVNYPIYAYPNYQVTDKDSGAVFPIATSAQQTIAVNIPAAYQGTLVLSYCVPALWRMAEAISALSALWVMAWALHTTGSVQKCRAIFKKNRKS